MNTVLYPPYIETKVRAQSGGDFYIPFRLNRAVSPTDVAYIKMKITTMVGNIEKGIYNSDTIISPYTEARFRNVDQLTVGQYYKIQLACVSKDNEIGHYSSVGTFKYTNEITQGFDEKNCIYIDRMTDSINNDQPNYVGVYKHSDIAEKVQSYCFNIYDESKKNLIMTSGEQLHNTQNDPGSSLSIDIWVANQLLEYGKKYYIEYTIVTINGMMCASPLYALERQLPQQDIDLENLHMSLRMVQDYENGTIVLKYIPTQNTVIFGLGEYVITRASNKDDFSTWENIYRFSLDNTSSMPKEIFIDFTVEQGVIYAYALQRYNGEANVVSDKVNFISYQKGIWEDYIVADFEDIFLFDGVRQFKIRFNPKIANVKATRLEKKIDTIGGKYPFIFSNGAVNYREMSISGLISYLSDDNELFVRKCDLCAANNPNNPISESVAASTNLTTENFIMERNFKTQLLSWLTNGQPKLLRSPAEGNFIVRLMNVSLSPSDTVSRMIHSFTSSAYEIAEYNSDNLALYNFIKNYNNLDNPSYTKYYNKFIPKAHYIELNEAADYRITYSDGLVENIHGPYILRPLEKLVVAVDSSEHIVSGILETPSPISYSPPKIVEQTTRTCSYIGPHNDIIVAEESRHDESDRLIIQTWSDIEFTNRFSLYSAYWKSETQSYQYLQGYADGQLNWQELEEDKIYQIAGSVPITWVERKGNNFNKLTSLDTTITIKEHAVPQRAISILDKLPFTNIDIDYLAIGNCVNVNGTYNYIEIKE